MVVMAYYAFTVTNANKSMRSLISRNIHNEKMVENNIMSWKNKKEITVIPCNV